MILLVLQQADHDDTIMMNKRWGKFFSDTATKKESYDDDGKDCGKFLNTILLSV